MKPNIKTDRNFRIVPSSDVDALITELKELGYNPVQRIPVQHPVTKIALPLRFLGGIRNSNCNEAEI